jgi:uncharacterized protein YprB with RNaseH-like and TPR domain
MLKRERVLGALAELAGKRKEKNEERTPDDHPPGKAPPQAGDIAGAHEDSPLAEILHGGWRQTEYGPAFVKDINFPLHHVHGNMPLNRVLGQQRDAIHRALCDRKSPPVSSLGFFDTETTGLSGGTGTYVFLAGLGSFEKNGFHLRQYFLSSLEDERPMLSALAQDLASLEGVVTYNGRSFDMPVLETRATLARLPMPWKNRPHFDLLRPVRRLYRHRLPSCRLSDAESHILRFQRQGDVPGHLIPALYFDYIRAGRIGPLRGVFRHNADDILSLVGVLASVAALLSQEALEASDAAAVARWWELENEPDRARALYQSALPGLEGGEDWPWAAGRYAMLLKRGGARKEAAPLWHRLWSQGDRGAGIEIAKYLEHEARDLSAAKEVTRTILASCPKTERKKVKHRLERLRRKLQGGWYGKKNIRRKTSRGNR